MQKSISTSLTKQNQNQNQNQVDNIRFSTTAGNVTGNDISQCITSCSIYMTFTVINLFVIHKSSHSIHEMACVTLKTDVLCSENHKHFIYALKCNANNSQ